MLSPRSLTWTHSPSKTQCTQTCGTTFNRSVLTHSHSCAVHDFTWQCVLWCASSYSPTTLCLVSGSSKHTRFIYTSLSPWHHEPLDSSNGLPSGHNQHPDRKHQPETLPVGSRLCGGEALQVQVSSMWTINEGTDCLMQSFKYICTLTEQSLVDETQI